MICTGPISCTSGSSLRLNAQGDGLGPHFKLKLNVQNTGSKLISNVPVMNASNQDIYRIPQSQLFFPVLVPSLIYLYEVDIFCLDVNAADVLRIYVCNPNSVIPSLSTLVKMPLSEIPMDE